MEAQFVGYRSMTYYGFGRIGNLRFVEGGTQASIGREETPSAHEQFPQLRAV